MAQSIIGFGQDVKGRLMALVGELRSGRSVEELEGPFRDVLEGTDLFEIERAEEELISEGLPIEDLKRLCDVHIMVMGEVSEQDETLLELPGHPIHTLMEEHLSILDSVGRMVDAAERMREAGSLEGAEEVLGKVREAPAFFRESQKHFQREENVLFPYLERHGVTGPPAVMWSEHQVLRNKEKQINGIIERREELGFNELVDRLQCVLVQMRSLLNAHFYKENHVLFPMAIGMIDVNEWREIKREFDEIGFCDFMPHQASMGFPTVRMGAPMPTGPGRVDLGTGEVGAEELRVLLNSLPVDITFVDKDDRVRYFSLSPDRVFLRTKAVIGREVQNCHPRKSLHVVQRIIDDFKAGRRDGAEFWIELEGRFIYIRYSPLRDDKGKYMGILEVVQDATRVRGLEGQKRLLDQ